MTKEGGLLFPTQVLKLNLEVWIRSVAGWPTHSPVPLIIFIPQKRENVSDETDHLYGGVWIEARKGKS